MKLIWFDKRNPYSQSLFRKGTREGKGKEKGGREGGEGRKEGKKLVKKVFWEEICPEEYVPEMEGVLIAFILWKRVVNPEI